MDFSRNRLALIEEIERVFGDVQRGAGVTLHQARVIDDYGTIEEETAARALDQESCWQDIRDELIQEYYEVLSFFDPRGAPLSRARLYALDIAELRFVGFADHRLDYLHLLCFAEFGKLDEREICCI